MANVQELFLACEKGDTAKVQKELAVTNVNHKGGWGLSSDMTALHVASGYGTVEVVRFLLREGADLDARDSGGRTPLHWAAYSGEVEICRALIEGGCDLNIQDKHGQTPLYRASNRGYLEICRILILVGADATIKNKRGQTPSDVAGTWQTAETELAKCKYCLNLNRTLLYRSGKVDYVVDSLLRYGIFKKDTPSKIKSQPVQSQMDELVSEIAKAAPIRWGEFLSALEDCGLGYAADALRQAMILYEENPQFTTEELDIFLLEGEFDPDTQGDRGRTRKVYSFVDKVRRKMTGDTKEKKIRTNILMLNQDFLIKAINLEPLLDSLQKNSFLEENVIQRIQSQPQPRQTSELLKALTNVTTLSLWGLTLCLRDTKQFGILWRLQETRRLQSKYKSLTAHQLTKHMEQVAHTHKEVMGMTQAYLRSELQVDASCTSLLHRKVLPESTIQEIQSLPDDQQFSQLMKALRESEVDPWFGLLYSAEETGQAHVSYRLKETQRLHQNDPTISAAKLDENFKEHPEPSLEGSSRGAAVQWDFARPDNASDLNKSRTCHKACITMNFPFLRREINLDILCDYLLLHKILNTDRIDAIQSHPVHRRHYFLLDELREMHPDPWEGLLSGLEESKQHHVAWRLKETERLYQENMNITVPQLNLHFRKHRAPRSFSSKPGTEDPLAHSGDSSIPINLKNTDPQLVLKVANNPEKYYQMSNMPRGKAIILNNENFSKSTLEDRTGSSVDERNLNEVFHALGFEVEIWRDLTAQEITRSVDELRKSGFHKNADSFVFIALSHGRKGVIFGVDGRTVNITEEIINPFDGKRCPQLIGKPKLFFIQACQGDGRTAGVSRPDGEDEDNVVPVRETAFLEEADAERNVHEKADILVFYATVPGYVSWRDLERGSWFMRELVVNLNKYAHEDHIVDILMKVNNQLTEYQAGSGHGVQVGELVSSLRKWLFFLPETDLDPAMEGRSAEGHLLPGKASAPLTGIRPSQKDCYKMDSIPRGFMLIINNVNFERLPKRAGSDADRDYLKKIFDGFGFNIELQNDLTKERMLKRINALADDSNEFKDTDSVALAILSHGEQGSIVGVDGLFMTMEEVIQPFRRTICPDLVGKPKLFILQVCHSRDYHAIDCSRDSPLSGPSVSFEASRDEGQASEDVEEVRAKTEGLHVRDQERVIKLLDPDMLIAYSTFPGQASHEDGSKGTCYIQSLCRILERHSQEEHIMDMLVKTNDEITKHSSETNVQCPQPTTTLKKKWYLKPLT